MNPGIASIHVRMAQGGDWAGFRAEIAALHQQASTEDEYITLLEAHHNLILVGESVYDPQTYARLKQLAKGEHQFFLAKEATEDGLINPVVLDRITRREVDAGRLDPNDEAVKIAAAAAEVLGDSAELTTPRKRNGDWFAYGMIAAATLAFGLTIIHQSPFWLVAVGLLIGWYINEAERRRIKKDIATRRDNVR